MGVGEGAIDCNSALEFRFAAGYIPSVVKVPRTQRKVGLGQGIVEFDGFAGSRFGFGRYFARRTFVVDGAESVSVGHARPRGGVIGLKLDRFLEIFEDVDGVELEPDIASAQ